MTRICEKFIENVSVHQPLSDELKKHLSECPECQQTFAALSSIKAARKGPSAREAAAIGGILKALNPMLEASNVPETATKGSGNIVKTVAIAISVCAAIAISVISGIWPVNKVPETAFPAATPIEEPVIAPDNSSATLDASEKVTDSQKIITISSTESEEITEKAVASQTETAQEGDEMLLIDPSEQPGAHLVSPDLEDVAQP